MNGLSRSSTSLVKSLAASASVLAKRTVGTSQTSAANLPAIRCLIACWVGNQYLAAHMAAFLFRRKLILQMTSCSARLDHGLDQLEDIERSPKPGFCVSDNRR